MSDIQAKSGSLFSLVVVLSFLLSIWQALNVRTCRLIHCQSHLLGPKKSSMHCGANQSGTPAISSDVDQFNTSLLHRLGIRTMDLDTNYHFTFRKGSSAARRFKVGAIFAQLLLALLVLLSFQLQYPIPITNTDTHSTTSSAEK